MTQIRRDRPERKHRGADRQTELQRETETDKERHTQSDDIASVAVATCSVLVCLPDICAT